MSTLIEFIPYALCASILAPTSAALYVVVMSWRAGM